MKDTKSVTSKKKDVHCVKHYGIEEKKQMIKIN